MLYRIFILILLLANAPAAFAQFKVEKLTFPTNVFKNTAAGREVMLKADLFLPEGAKQKVSVVVITPSSGGVKEEREVYYARELAKSGIAALVIDSFGSRGLRDSVVDQSVLIAWEIENDAVAALKLLRRDPRIHAGRIGVLGVSKGGIVALNTAMSVRRNWFKLGEEKFAAHVPIAPSCSTQMRDISTTKAPIFFMLAELDDQTPAAPCVNLAEKMRASGARIEVKIYEGAHHAWERLGEKPYFDAKAENYRHCRSYVENDGSTTMVSGEKVPKDWHPYLKGKCMTLGTHCCGGNEKLKAEATRDMIAFLRRQGF